MWAGSWGRDLEGVVCGSARLGEGSSPFNQARGACIWFKPTISSSFAKPPFAIWNSITTSPRLGVKARSLSLFNFLSKTSLLLVYFYKFASTSDKMEVTCPVANPVSLPGCQNEPIRNRQPNALGKNARQSAKIPWHALAIV